MEENTTKKSLYKLSANMSDIKKEVTTPYNTQQNGVVERKNITIMEAVKTMIHDQDLLMFLWAEAVRTIVYVQNRFSHSALGFKTPKEMFSRKNPKVSHLNVDTQN
jgi:hypothetical protein